MDGLGLWLVRVDPGFHHLENDEIIIFDEAPICDLAFKIGEAFRDPTAFLADLAVKPKVAN